MASSPAQDDSGSPITLPQDIDEPIALENTAPISVTSDAAEIPAPDDSADNLEAPPAPPAPPSPQTSSSPPSSPPPPEPPALEAPLAPPALEAAFLPGITIAFDDEDDVIAGSFAPPQQDDDESDEAEGSHDGSEDPISAADDEATARRLCDASVAAQRSYEAEQRRVADAAQRRALVEELDLVKGQQHMSAQRLSAAESALVDMFARQKVAPAPMDRDLTHAGLMARVAALEDSHSHATAASASTIHRLKAVFARDNVEMAIAAEAALEKLQRATLRTCVSEATGKAVPGAMLQVILDREREIAEKLRVMRIRVLALQKGLQSTEGTLTEQEKQSEGVHIMHYEQLKIENHAQHEKIEERNEDIMKLKAKITEIVQVLTHLKEKMNFVEGESMNSKERVLGLERELARKRDELSRTKHVRDKLRVDNISLKNRCGLVGNTKLLRDYETRHDEAEMLEMQLAQLKTRYAEVSLNVQGFRTKLERLAAAQPTL